MREEIRRAVLSELDIPPLPEAALRVQRLAEDPTTTAKDMASVISTDSTLTALLLKQANSPFYGFPKKIGTVSLAVVVLGFDAVREIALSTVAIQHTSLSFDPKIIDTGRFWSHSLAVATGSRLIATHWKTCLAGEAFVAGLLHDIGRLILANHWADQYRNVAVLCMEKEMSTSQAEREIFLTDHPEVAGWLCERWQLPEQITNGISGHHLKASEIDHGLTRTVAVANAVAHRNGFRHDQREPAPKLPQELVEPLSGFNETDLASDLKELYRKAESMLDFISARGQN